MAQRRLMKMVMYAFLTKYVPYTGDSEKDLDTLIESIFPNLNENMANKDYITSIEPFYQHVMIGYMILI
jgi:hypothetical protein